MAEFSIFRAQILICQVINLVLIKNHIWLKKKEYEDLDNDIKLEFVVVNNLVLIIYVLKNWIFVVELDFNIWSIFSA